MIPLPCRFARRGFFLLIICKKYGPAMVRIVERRGEVCIMSLFRPHHGTLSIPDYTL